MDQKGIPKGPYRRTHKPHRVCGSNHVSPLR